MIDNTYLNKEGLAYFWSKVKTFISSAVSTHAGVKSTNSSLGHIKSAKYHSASSTGITPGTDALAVAVNAVSATGGRYYAVETDSNGYGIVNVPWTDTKYTLSSFGVTATSTELNFCDGVTSNIQTQLNGKAASSHTHTIDGISDLNSSWDALLKAAPSTYVTRWPAASEVTGRQSFIIKINSGTSEGTNLYTYNLTAAKTLDIKAGSNVTLNAEAGSLTITAKDTTYGVASGSSNGLMSSADKTKLDGIAANANNYTHPTSSGNKHIPSGGSAGQILRWSADGTAAWGADNNTTYTEFKGATSAAEGASGLVKKPVIGDQAKFLKGDGTWASTPYPGVVGANGTTGLIKNGSSVTSASGYTPAPIIDGVPYYKDTNTTYTPATTSANGLMSSTDKAKLDGIAANANNYTHPATHPASIITETDDRKFVTPTEKNAWNAKATHSVLGNIKVAKYHSVAATGITPGTDALAVAVNAVSSTGGRYYAVETDSNGYGIVNVPWTDTKYTLETFGVTAKASELNFCSGVTSSIQNQLNGKAASSHTHTIDGISDLDSGWDTLLKAAPSAYVTRWPKVSEVTEKQNLTIKINSGKAENTDLYTYNLTAAKALDLKNGTGIVISGAAGGAITFTHSSANGFKHIPADGAANQVLVYSAAGTAKWGTIPSSTVSVMTGYSKQTAAAISASDTLNQAIGKLEGKIDKIDAEVSKVEGSVLILAH